MLEEVLGKIFVNQWVVLFVITLLLLLLAEVGFRFGLTARNKNADVAQGHSGSIQGAVLGLLGLLLGFSFAMAVGRYDARRLLIVAEANSIGTTWLRADFLPSPHKEEVKDILVRYTRLRTDHSVKPISPEELVQLHQESGVMQLQLWAHASAVAQTNPSPMTASFVNSLNDTIDQDSNRVAAARNHVPAAVWLLLMMVAGTGAWASGYGTGSNGIRSAFSLLIFPILIGVVITLISDIDRPRRGIIGVSQKPFFELLEMIDSEN